MSFLPPLPPTFDAALRDIGAKNPRFRMAAATRLGQPEAGREEEAITALRTLTQDEMGPIRAAAFDALGDAKGGLDADEVRRGAADPHADVRAATLHHAEPARDEEVLRTALEDVAGSVRAAAIGQLATPTHAELAAALDDPDPYVAHAACLVIARAIPDHADRLARLSVAAPAGRALGAVHALATLEDPRARDALLFWLDHRGPRTEALRLLGEHPRIDVTEALHALSRRFLISALDRVGIAAALAARGDEAAAPILRKALRDRRLAVRYAALDVLEQHRLRDLRADVEALRAKPRGVEPARIEAALASL